MRIGDVYREGYRYGTKEFSDNAYRRVQFFFLKSFVLILVLQMIPVG